MIPPMEPSQTTADSTDRKFVLGALSLGHGIVHWLDQSFPVVLPSITASLGLTNIQVGSIATVKQIGFGLVNLPGGLVVDLARGQWGLILIGCLVSAALLYALLGLSFSFGFMVVIVFLASIPGALWHLPASAALSQRFPERRGFAISIHGFGANIGNAVGPLVAGALILVINWRGIFFIYAVPTLLVGLVIWAYLRNIGQESVSRRNVSMGQQIVESKSLLQNRLVMVLVAVAVLRGMALNSMFIWTPFYLTDELGMSSFWMGFHMALATGTGIISTPILGSLSDRYNRKSVLVPGLALGAILSALVLPAGNSIWLTVVMAGIGLFSYALFQIIQAAVLDLAKEGTEATATGFLFGIGSVVGAFSPMLAVVIINNYGIGNVFYYQAGLSALALLILLPFKLPSPERTNSKS
ncbi:MFS transporter [SAR202 cluster bacterium AD-804-J14_MRT_500m]|nr:MFS transporter [SAR202 cluster bacterium AD-804-J14_MRT_500m]